MALLPASEPYEKANEPQSIRLGRARAALVVYRMDRGRPQFLLVSAASDTSKLTLPGGKIGSSETPAAAAMRETAEEAGVLTDPPIALGQYLHYKRKRRVYPTQTFLAPCVGTLREREDRVCLWISLDEMLEPAYRIRKPIRKQLKQAERVLRDRCLAA